jgi:hypothetical protein
VTIYYRAGYKYQLAESYSVQTPIKPSAPVKHEFFTLTKTGKLWIKRGYAWDGASGPTFDTKSSMRPSLVHDVFCQIMQTGKLDYDLWQDKVNELFKQQCIEDGMWPPRAWIWYQAVEFANAGHPDQPDSNPIQEAP